MFFEDLVYYDGCSFLLFLFLVKDVKKYLEVLWNMKICDDDVIMIMFFKCGMKIVFYFMIIVKLYFKYYKYWLIFFVEY